MVYWKIIYKKKNSEKWLDAELKAWGTDLTNKFSKSEGKKYVRQLFLSEWAKNPKDRTIKIAKLKQVGKLPKRKPFFKRKTTKRRTSKRRNTKRKKSRKRKK